MPYFACLSSCSKPFTTLQEKITLSPFTSRSATLFDFKHCDKFSLYTHSIILPFKCKSRATTPSFSYFSPPTYSLAPEALDISKHSINGNATIKANIDDLIKHSNQNTRVCFIANPNNPTGTYLTKSEIKELRVGLPKKCLLVIDSAYSEYVTEKDYSDSLSYAKTRNDVIVTKTFSKIFGMAALRLGWAYCPEQIVQTLNKIRPAFNINSYAQEIAINLLDDKKFLKNSIAHNLYWKKWLTNKFNDLGFEVIPSVANFIMVKFKSAKQASKLADSLEKSNIFIRKLNNYKLSDCLRISIGSEKDLKKLLREVKKITAGTNK